MTVYVTLRGGTEQVYTGVKSTTTWQRGSGSASRLSDAPVFLILYFASGQKLIPMGEIISYRKEVR